MLKIISYMWQSARTEWCHCMHLAEKGAMLTSRVSRTIQLYNWVTLLAYFWQTDGNNMWLAFLVSEAGVSVNEYVIFWHRSNSSTVKCWITSHCPVSNPAKCVTHQSGQKVILWVIVQKWTWPTLCLECFLFNLFQLGRSESGCWWCWTVWILQLGLSNILNVQIFSFSTFNT